MEFIEIPKIDKVVLLDKLQGNNGPEGTLHLTVSQIFFMDASGKHQLWIPTCLIHYVERLPIASQSFPLLIHCKHFLKVKFKIPNDRDSQSALMTIRNLCFIDHPTKLTCFTLRSSQVAIKSGWKFFSMEEEFLKMGVPNKLWVVSNMNNEYEVCDTYPRVLYVPSNVITPTLLGSCRFRSRGRLPVLTYLHTDGKSALCRCSQPLVGFSARCVEDEQLLQAILRSNTGSRILHVVDTRPMINAAINRAQGKGYEDENVYKNIDFKFFDIDNIHVMRASLEKLIKACEEPFLSTSAYLGSIEKCGWLKHIRIILETSNYIAQCIHQGNSVLVHCSDGWDRTAQTCSLAQILLNPRYRTFQGLQSLIEKDWLSFGHKFTDRLGLVDTADKQEASPVFLQFLDCLWQLMQQFPQHFEYNERLLITLFEESMAARFGTFVGNCEKDRLDFHLDQLTESLWGHLAMRLNEFLNPLYSSEINQGVLEPNLAPQTIQVWRGIYNRWDKYAQSQIDRTHALSSLFSYINNIGIHCSFLEARVRYLCTLLGKDQETTENKAKGFAHSESMFSVKDLDSSESSEDVASCLVPAVCDDPLLSFATNSASDTSPDEHAGRSLVDNMLCLDPPTAEHLVKEMISTHLEWSAGRFNLCQQCNKPWDYAAYRFNCRGCGYFLCNSCVELSCSLPGLPEPVKVTLCRKCSQAASQYLRSLPGPASKIVQPTS